MSRWLSDDEKESTLSYWHHTRGVVPENIEVKHQFVAGGYGWPDPSIHPWCDRLNVLDGVCTVSSCVGHLIINERYSDGHLWLRLSEKVNVFLELAMPVLVEVPTITTLAKHYFLADAHVPWEWLEIEFAGGDATLTENVGPIVEEVERLFAVE